MTEVADLRGLFAVALADVLHVERVAGEMLEQLARDAGDDALGELLEAHRERTRAHVEALERVFGLVGVEPEESDSRIVEALAEKHRETVAQVDDRLRSVVVVESAAMNRHYEIAAYEVLVTVAQALGEHEALDLLHGSLRDEQQALAGLHALSARIAREAQR